MKASTSPEPRAFGLATVRVLLGRDVTRLVREPRRVAWALAPAVLLWAVLGVGLQGSFRVEGAEGLTSLQALFPGALVLTVLLGALLAADAGGDAFLPWVLAGPGSRLAVVVGRVLGACLPALVSGLLFLLLVPLAGVPLSSVGLLAVGLVLTAVAFAAGGVALSFWGASPSRARPWVGGGLLLLWALSGAPFPPRGAGPVLQVLVSLNPVHFAVVALQRALLGEAVAAAVGGAGSLWGTLGGLVMLTVGLFALALVGGSRRP